MSKGLPPFSTHSFPDGLDPERGASRTCQDSQRTLFLLGRRQGAHFAHYEVYAAIMILSDLHTHTHHSHGTDTVEAMILAAIEKNIRVLGFSEHDPRPANFSYPSDYQDKLNRQFPIYVGEVRALQGRYREKIHVLLGVEFDFFPGHEARIAVECRDFGFDYAIGAVHFLSEWGFDFAAGDWQGLSQDALFEVYERYFEIVGQMAGSGLFQIAAHLDLVKIFSGQSFAAWIDAGCGDKLLDRALEAMADFNMALEVSSAGLRKPCREIYPCPRIMTLARQKSIPIALASDAHTIGQLGFGFDQLLKYVREFGYETSVWFEDGVLAQLPLG